MLSREDFNKEFARIQLYLEMRRRHHLKYFYLNSTIAAVLLIVAFFEPGILGTEGLKPKLFILLFCVWLVLFPIFRYRGTNATASLKPSLRNPFSLKDEAYSRLFKAFGPLEFAPRGGISLMDIRKSTLFPDHSAYFPEDYVVGRVNDMVVKLCEANITRLEGQRRLSVFRGLLLVCDISEMHVKLRAGFKGRTVLIDDRQKSEDAAKRNYGDMRKLPLPGKFETALEGYTTDMAEAKSVVTEGLLTSIDSLATRLHGLKEQTGHWDDKLAYAIDEYYDYYAGRITGIFRTDAEGEEARPGDFELPAEGEFDKKTEGKLDITKADPVSRAITSLNQQFEIEFYENKFIVTLPCKYDMFETNSIFEPALSDEDARLVYDLMQCIDAVTSHLAKIEP